MENKMGRACNTHRKKMNSRRVLVVNTEAKRPLERPRKIILKWIAEKQNGV
jgi:hypothetical protein